MMKVTEQEQRRMKSEYYEDIVVGGLNASEVAKYSDLWHLEGCISEHFRSGAR